MGTYMNQGRGGNLAVQTLGVSGPYAVMNVVVPISFYFGFEPEDPASQVPSDTGTPAWTGREEGLFKQLFQDVVRTAWRRKYPVYGRRRSGVRDSHGATGLHFDRYASVKVDVDVQAANVPPGDTSPQKKNTVWVFRVPRGRPKRYPCKGDWRTAIALVYEDDVLESRPHGYPFIAAPHEVGHLMGLEHIGANNPGCMTDPSGGLLLSSGGGNMDVCYMEGTTWSPNIMGTGTRVYQEQYDVFAGLLDTIMPDFAWRVERWGSGTRLG